MIIAGEVSGDIHGAALVRALQNKLPALEVAGTGGEQMRAAGVEILYDIEEMAVMGLAEVLKHLRRLRQIFAGVCDYAVRQRPDAVVLIDYPGFNLRLANHMHRHGIPVIYYICPQVWAWKRSRIKQMARTIKHLITIFPFENRCFDDTGLAVDYVGHPLVDELAEARREWVDAANPLRRAQVALLPGSRTAEITRLLPVMLAAAEKLAVKHPELKFVIAAASPGMEKVISGIMAGMHLPSGRFEIVCRQTRRVLCESRAAVVASGTATVETALLGCPMVVIYKVAPLTYAIGRLVVNVPHIGMVNILAGREICPELLQGAATPAAVAAALEPLTHDTPQRRRMCDDLAGVAAALGTGGSAAKAAEIVARYLG